jgi:hypothetical protein
MIIFSDKVDVEEMRNPIQILVTIVNERRVIERDFGEQHTDNYTFWG